MGRIPVMEIFGPTLQGEGMAIGRKTMFVRTGGCDYRCIWCDSKFTWDGSQKATMMSAAEIWSELLKIGGHGFDYVTISGGNPALIGDSMRDLVHTLHENGMRVGLETQGSQFQEWFADIDDLTISPKPPSSGMTVDWSRLHEIVERLRHTNAGVSWKVVVFHDADYTFATKIHSSWPSMPFFLSVGNDDIAEDGDVSQRLLDRLRWLTELVLADDAMNGVRVLPQLHVLMWGNRRGV